MKQVAGLRCLGFPGLTACYVLALVVMPAYAVAETAFQLPMFAPRIEAWAYRDMLGWANQRLA